MKTLFKKLSELGLMLLITELYVCVIYITQEIIGHEIGWSVMIGAIGIGLYFGSRSYKIDNP